MHTPRQGLSHSPAAPGRELNPQERRQVAGGFLGSLIKKLPTVARRTVPVSPSP